MLALMSAVPNLRFNVDDYLAWADEQPGRYELVNGVVYAMSPESIGHIERKTAIQAALSGAIRARSLPFHALGDGATVRIGDDSAYEPDALVYCGQRLAPSEVEVRNPIIVVEVLSPSTRHVDLSFKLTGYFRLPSVAHYLIADPTERVIVHHARATDGTIITRIVTEGTIVLDPPGFELTMANIYDAS
jgi:Uma2 family endonuclease